MFFNKNHKISKAKPQPRGFYAFNEQRAGDFLIFVTELDGYFQFLYIPGGTDFYMTPEDFSSSISNETLTLVEQLPQDIFDESISLSLPPSKKLEYISVL